MRTRQAKTWMTLLVGLAFVAAFVAAPALAEEKYQEKFAKTEALAKTGTFYLINVAGDIEIAVWKEAQVKIEAVKIGIASSLDKAKEDAAKVTIEVTKTGDSVRVETKFPKKEGGFFGRGPINVRVDYKVWVPEQAAVETRSVSGDVVVAALGGKAKIDSVSGEISLAGAAGAEIKLVSGDLKMGNIAGDAFIKAVSGDIDVAKVKGSIEADAVSGDIELRDVAEAQTVDIKTVSGNVTYVGDLKAGGRYELKTHSGDVRMTIPAGAGFDLEANTFSGTIDSEFEITVSGKISPKEGQLVPGRRSQQIVGTVGKGGATLILRSFSGNVDLKKK